MESLRLLVIPLEGESIGECPWNDEAKFCHGDTETVDYLR
jgi:hypothetical protein